MVFWGFFFSRPHDDQRRAGGDVGARQPGCVHARRKDRRANLIDSSLMRVLSSVKQLSLARADYNGDATSSANIGRHRGAPR